jgi:hypothetical protein
MLWSVLWSIFTKRKQKTVMVNFEGTINNKNIFISKNIMIFLLHLENDSTIKVLKIYLP